MDYIDSYYSAWLHTHYEKEWLATCLQTLNGSNKFGKIISEIKSLGYKILLPDINASSDVWVYSEERNGFVPPLTAMELANSLGSFLVFSINLAEPKKVDKTIFLDIDFEKPIF